MPTTSVTTFSMNAGQDSEPRVQSFSSSAAPRPSWLTSALSVVLGLVMLGIALIILIPIAFIAIVLVGVWLVWALVIGGLSRLNDRTGGAGRRNVRVVGPRHDL